MIGRLKGSVDDIAPDQCLIDVGGVGYVLYCSRRTLSALPGVGRAVALDVETHVREDHIHLYGFIDAAERDWFRLLTGVQGVGARVALAILSVLEPDALIRAVAAQDKAAVARANGVGPKLAGRIVAELKDKVGGMALGGAALAAGPNGAAAPGPAAGANEDAVSALVNLGYGRSDAFAAIAKAAVAAGEGADVAALIRGGLRELGR